MPFAVTSSVFQTSFERARIDEAIRWCREQQVAPLPWLVCALLREPYALHMVPDPAGHLRAMVAQGTLKVTAPDWLA